MEIGERGIINKSAFVEAIYPIIQKKIKNHKIEIVQDSFVCFLDPSEFEYIEAQRKKKVIELVAYLNKAFNGFKEANKKEFIYYVIYNIEKLLRDVKVKNKTSRDDLVEQYAMINLSKDLNTEYEDYEELELYNINDSESESNSDELGITVFHRNSTFIISNNKIKKFISDALSEFHERMNKNAYKAYINSFIYFIKKNNVFLPLENYNLEANIKNTIKKILIADFILLYNFLIKNYCDNNFVIINELFTKRSNNKLYINKWSLIRTKFVREIKSIKNRLENNGYIFGYFFIKSKLINLENII
ncbi:MAG: hypothetical protein QXF12_01750 [Candidatus Aenigmatarchaeota archaeon]